MNTFYKIEDGGKGFGSCPIIYLFFLVILAKEDVIVQITLYQYRRNNVYQWRTQQFGDHSSTNLI